MIVATERMEWAEWAAAARRILTNDHGVDVHSTRLAMRMYALFQRGVSARRAAQMVAGEPDA